MQKIKEIAKRILIIKILYTNLLTFYKKILFSISPVLLVKYNYKRIFGKRINFNSPENFNEKILWLLFNWRHPLVVKCADKYKVRDYVKECGYDEILNDLIGVYSDANDIDFENLPNKFVLKCNHGCGYNIICEDKSKFNQQDAIQKLNRWLKEKYGKKHCELHYDKITPMIICEKYIDTLNSPLPVDYKIYCINYEPIFTLVCSDRHTNVKLDYFDLNWNTLQYTDESYKSNNIFEKPSSFNNMIEIAKKLAAPFPFVRVDFYEVNGKAVFGEMTFTPAGGMLTCNYDDVIQKLGEMIKLPQEKILNGW